MQAVFPHVCGLDVHKDTVVACALLGPADGKPTKHQRTFRTFTRDLLELRDWLKELGVTHVAMESTGVYWRPVYGVLEDDFDLLVANAQHVKNVPGRKTDVKDSEWLASLSRFGLLRASFVPPADFRDLRELLRYRRKLVDQRTSERNRLHKVLQTAGIKLGSVASDVFGKSGLAMVKALAEGTQTPEQMAQLARGQLRKKEELLTWALQGELQEHHRLLLRVQLRRLEHTEQDIAEVEEHIERVMKPYEPQRQLLRGIPGVSQIVATTILAEIGVNMAVFSSAGHLASWAGMCPGNNESAGKRGSGRTRKGNKFLRSILVEAAHAASRKRHTYLKDKFWKLCAHLGKKRAAMAVGHKILTSVYVMLRDQVEYRDLGEGYLDQRKEKHTVRKLTQRLEKMGYSVEVTKAPVGQEATVTAPTA